MTKPKPKAPAPPGAITRVYTHGALRAVVQEWGLGTFSYRVLCTIQQLREDGTWA